MKVNLAVPEISFYNTYSVGTTDEITIKIKDILAECRQKSKPGKDKYWEILDNKLDCMLEEKVASPIPNPTKNPKEKTVHRYKINKEGKLLHKYIGSNRRTNREVNANYKVIY